MGEREKLEVDVISDVMCPWCYIGKVNLDKALLAVPELDVTVRWRPYQLDATLPKEGKDRSDYLNAKFGGKEGAKQVYDRIREAGKSVGIDFNFEAIAVSPNTIDAHRVILWAGGHSVEIQNRLVERLFEIFFLEGGNIGLDAVLVEAARETGMDAKIVADLLPTKEDHARVCQDIANAREMGVTGVPCFIIDNKYAVMGAQPSDQLANAMRQAVQERAKDQ